MTDLTKKPFCLDSEQIRWVNETLDSMTLDEKIGQLFINMTMKRKPEDLEKLVKRYHIGGVRWQGGTLDDIYEQNRYLQENSRIPCLIAGNFETGGAASVPGGVEVASGAACAAAQGEETVRDMACVGAEEGLAVGANWSFAPVCDILLNWENTIVNTRAFGNDPDQVIRLSKAYMEEMHKRNIACAAKHFPGDGSDGRDQHLVMSCNDLSCEEWDRTYGRVYQEMIDAGVESIMVGHISQRAYEKKFNPALEDKDIKPATLSRELLQNLLREQLGFNGVIVTDAMHMGGITSAASRRDAIPGVIEAGCDMILFFHDPDEDIRFFKEGLENGKVSEERFHDALRRILGLKAKLALHKLVFPSREGLSQVGSKEHHNAAYKAADASITLVKDVPHVLPLDPVRNKRLLMVFVKGNDDRTVVDGLVRELEMQGFDVTAPPDLYDLERQNGRTPMNIGIMMGMPSTDELRAKYDAVLLVTDMKGYAQTNNVRVCYSLNHSREMPWYVHELPTIGISLSSTNQLYDLPMMKTFINVYSDTPEYLRALAEKLAGKTPFKGKANDIVWCGRWDTRL